MNFNKSHQMSNKELFKLIDKDFKGYDKFYQGYIDLMIKNGTTPTQDECLYFLKTFFNQVKNREVN